MKKKSFFYNVLGYSERKRERNWRRESYTITWRHQQSLSYSSWYSPRHYSNFRDKIENNLRKRYPVYLSVFDRALERLRGDNERSLDDNQKCYLGEIDEILWGGNWFIGIWVQIMLKEIDRLESEIPWFCSVSSLHSVFFPSTVLQHFYKETQKNVKEKTTLRIFMYILMRFFGVVQ